MSFAQTIQESIEIVVLGGRRLGGLFEHGQQTLCRHAFVRHDAEETAGRHAGIVDQSLEMFLRWKSLAQFPCVDCGYGNATLGGDFFQRNVVLPAPCAKCFRKAGADVAMQWRVGFLHHNGD